MPVFLTKILIAHWKKILTLFLFIGVGVGSYIYGRNSVATQVSEKTEESEKINEKTSENKTKEKITVVVKRPDGTEEIRIIEREVSNIAHETSKAKEKVSSKVSKKEPQVKNKYRVGVLAQTNPYDLYKGKAVYSYSGTASYRLVNRLWVDGIYNFNKKEAGLGLSLEF